MSIRKFVRAALVAALSLPALAQQPPGVTQSLGALADQPGTHTSFTFDRSLMQIAQNLLESNGMDAKRAGAALTGISVVNGNQTPASTAQPRSAATDLWLHFNGGDIDDLVVLIRASRDMNVITVTGDLRPLDLLHLSGHFGIPKIDPNAVMVPAPR